MKSRIINIYPETQIVNHSSKMIFVADFTERTKSQRSIEVFNVIPACPLDPKKQMDVMTVHNENNLNVAFATFDDHSFKKEDSSNDEKHPEGCFIIDDLGVDTFFSLYEIKDCKAKNITKYKDNIQSKIIKTASVLRANNIIDNDTIVCAFASFPRRNKTVFNDYFFNDSVTMKNFIVAHKINLYATNHISIVNNRTCLPL